MKFALAGNPNSGKTTLFNALTGSTAHVGNWPGVTVDKKEGVYKKLSEKIDIVDLPGIYSLSPYSPEEVVSRNFLLNEKPDLIINIIDATNLERNLYLTTQLLELDTPIVIALNMIDSVEKNGDAINALELEEKLGAPVIEISALKQRGIHKLMERAYQEAKKSRVGESVFEGTKYQNLFFEIKKLYENEGVDNICFHTVKMFEGDQIEKEKYPDIACVADKIKDSIDTGDFEGDFEGIVADLRYKKIIKDYATAYKRSKPKEAMTRSDKIDKVLTHRVFAIPMFLLIMFAVFHLTFSEDFLYLGAIGIIPKGSFSLPVIGEDAIPSPGVLLYNCIEELTTLIGNALYSSLPKGAWYTSLLVDGLFSGLSSVLSFIPQIMVLFLFLTILEDSGYMARVAFIMDRAGRKFGLSGRSFMPLIMCFGCAVPGIMATRTLENEAERRRTVMLTPFFSCGAKLPIWAAFGGVFAQAFSVINAEAVVYGMYILGIAVAIIAAMILNKTLVKGDMPPFIMELPAYHAPQFKNLVLHLWDKLKHYLARAATVIAGSVVVIWFLTSFNFSWQMVDDPSDSIIGNIGKFISFIFVPLGFGMGENGWKFVVAAFTGLIAKEMVVASIGTFSGMDGGTALETDGSELLGTPMAALMLGIGGVIGGLDVSIPAMLSFLAFNLLSVPCMAAVASANAELGDKKSLIIAIIFWLATSYTMSLVIFWVGAFFVWNWWAALITVLGIAAILITLAALSAKGLLKTRKIKKETKAGKSEECVKEGL
ncbi:MAG: ferrous iron transporter B [Clostridiales bacterium]|nr:ferrous iron transporter B [Clostridiales bacterium]